MHHLFHRKSCGAWAFVNSQKKPSNLLKHWCGSHAVNKWCVAFPFDESTLSNDDMDECPLHHTWAFYILRNGTETYRVRTVADTDGIKSHSRQLLWDDSLCTSGTMQESTLQMSEIRVTSLCSLQKQNNEQTHRMNPTLIFLQSKCFSFPITLCPSPSLTVNLTDVG